MSQQQQQQQHGIISANAGPQPVSLCYRRTHTLLPRQHQDPAIPQPFTPAAFPCPPLYRNKHRLPFVQHQWWRETLQAGARREERRVDERQDGSQVWEEETHALQADWSWTLARLVQMICKEDAAQPGKDRKAEKRGRGQPLDADVRDKAVQRSVTMVEKKLQLEVAEEKEREEEVKTEGGGLIIRVDAAVEAGDSASADDAARSSPLSRAQQKTGSEAEEEEVKAASPSAAARQPKSPRSALSSPQSARRRSLSSSSSPSPRRSPPASPRPQQSAAEREVLSSFIPLPAHFLPSLLISSCGSSRVVWLDTEKEGGGGGAGGGQWLLSALRDRWQFGLEESGRVGVLVLLRLFGYAVWVRQREIQRQSWTRQLRADDGDGAEQQGGKGKK